MMDLRRWVAVVLVSGMSCLGCGHKAVEYKTVPVSGVLTCQGKPVEAVVVVFSPRAEHGREESAPGRSAIGRTDANGKFVLTTYSTNDGAVPGKHTVTIMVMDDPRAPVPKESKKNVAPCLNQTKEVEVSIDTPIVAINLGE